MPPHWLRQSNCYVWVLFCKQSARPRQIAKNMNARGQKVWKHDHYLCSPIYATRSALKNGRGRRLQKTSLDNTVVPAGAHLRDQMVQVGVRFLLPAAVRDEKQGGFRKQRRSVTRHAVYSVRREFDRSSLLPIV